MSSTNYFLDRRKDIIRTCKDKKINKTLDSLYKNGPEQRVNDQSYKQKLRYQHVSYDRTYKRKYNSLTLHKYVKQSYKLYRTFSVKQNREKESLQTILSSSEYLSWANKELFKPIHNVLKDNFIKIDYFRSDVLFKLMNILKYLEEKNYKVKEGKKKKIKIIELQNFLLRVIKCLGHTMNITISVEQFPLETDFVDLFDSTWKRIWKVSNGINMNLYKGSLKYRNVIEMIDKWLESLEE